MQNINKNNEECFLWVEILFLVAVELVFLFWGIAVCFVVGLVNRTAYSEQVLLENVYSHYIPISAIVGIVAYVTLLVVRSRPPCHLNDDDLSTILLLQRLKTTVN